MAEISSSSTVSEIEVGDPPVARGEYWSRRGLWVSGRKSQTDPTTGSAVWSGIVRASDASSGDYGRPIEGEARLVVDLSAATVDVRFTDFAEEHADMAWTDLPLAKAVLHMTTRVLQSCGCVPGSRFPAP